MPQIVRNRNRPRQFLVQAKRNGNGAAYGIHMVYMLNSRADVIIVSAVKKHLRLMFEPAKSKRMQNPRIISSELASYLIRAIINWFLAAYEFFPVRVAAAGGMLFEFFHV